MQTILVVDDQPRPRRALADELRDAGFAVVEAADGDEAWTRFEHERPDLVITDLVMPRSDGLELLSRIRARTETPVLLFTAYGTVPSAVAALKGGAEEFIVSPDVELDELVALVRRALERRAITRVPTELAHRLVGPSPGIARVRERIAGLAPLRTPVLVTGEAGSGRDTVVQALHDLGSSAGTRLLRVENAPPSVSLEGIGALYLDGVDAFDQQAQAQWARRLGTDGAGPRGPRLFASAAEPLATLAQLGRLHPLLADGLARFEIALPPLRRRPEDLPDLARALLERIGAEVGRCIELSAPTLDLLRRQRWPENARQLERVLERSVAYSRGPLIRRRTVLEVIAELEESVATIRERHGEVERVNLLAAIRETGGNVTRTAELLGKSRSAVYRLIEKHGIPLERPD
jgi:DNA-binding NtrC family response regulator